MRAIVALFCVAASAASSHAAEAAKDEPHATPLLAEVLSPPHVVPGSDGKRHLVYEIRLSNVTDGRAEVTRIEIRDRRSGRAIGAMDSEAVAGRLTPGAHRGGESSTLEAYQFGIVFMHVALAAEGPLPIAIDHEVSAVLARTKAKVSMRVAPTTIDVKSPVVLGPPLRGQGYIVGDGCCDSVRHVRALLPIHGALHLAQRYAIDWEKVNEEGRLFIGDAKDVGSYHIYREPVLAVADGAVVDARNDLPDQRPGALPAGLPLDEANGNFVILDIGGGAYALFAHMIAGSVKVRAGDRVKRGDAIGQVGNSGNSQAPHLHLQIMDRPSGLASNGLPYVFDSLTITAVDEAGTADFDMAEAKGTALKLTPRIPTERQQNILPLDLSVVDWGN